MEKITTRAPFGDLSTQSGYRHGDEQSKRGASRLIRKKYFRQIRRKLLGGPLWFPRLFHQEQWERLRCPLSDSMSRGREHRNDAPYPLPSGRGLRRVFQIKI
ncbi:hypothetical protein A7D33_06620 [Candidatus Methylacidiphilum fumarolicum]|nr:hypothetical protein A7D33_06620 [Candidatus Methylacidiphilum fumarolicum]